jgi:hypothetical protein
MTVDRTLTLSTLFNASRHLSSLILLRSVDFSRLKSVDIFACHSNLKTVSLRYAMPDPSRPYRSKLADHLDEIRHLRRARQTWRAIAQHLTNNRGVRLTASGVHIFFKRSARRRRLPLGFEDQTSSEATGPSQLRPARTPTEQRPQHQTPNDDIVSVMPINQPKKDPWFGSWTPEQGINYTPKN